MGNIKNKIIFGVIFAAIFSAGVFSMILLSKKGALSNSTASLDIKPKLTSNIELEKKLEQPEIAAQPKEKAYNSPMLLDTDYFSFILPVGWENSEATNTLPIIIVDTKERITNEKAKKIDFRTNISINSTELGDASLGDYVETVKAKLMQTIRDIEIVREGQISKKDGNASYYMEIKSAQQDLDFSTFLFFAASKNNTVWVFSFNTLQEAWPDYKDIFQQIVDSIIIKSE